MLEFLYHLRISSNPVSLPIERFISTLLEVHSPLCKSSVASEFEDSGFARF